MNNKITNPETEVSKTIEMNDRDYLNCVLEALKNMSNNLSYALNEASNTQLFNNFHEIFNDVKKASRDAYNLAFKNGWYSLEKAEEQKIQEKIQELNQKMNELNQ